ncbi:MAG: MarC family protein [Candidatus Aenigmatarchaeota archaeon]
MADALYILALFAVQLFLIVDPLAIVPVFLTLTKSNSRKERIRIARVSVVVASVVLLVFSFFGSWLLAHFGISINAVKIGGGLLLLIIGFEMVYGKYTGSELTEKEQHLATRMDDISITPLAIPLMSGPGAITTVILFSGSAGSASGYLIMILGIILVGIASYLIISNSDRIKKALGDIGTKVVVWVMGILIVFLATQYIIDGLSAVLGGVI